jgi:hypothetical protein
MNTTEARELLKSAVGMPTYPISRAITHPATSTLGVAGVGSVLEGLATGGNTGIGALVGGGLGYLSNKINRFIHARALVSRGISSQPEHMQEVELSAIRKLLGQKEAAAADVASPYPISEVMTSRSALGTISGLRAGISTGEPAVAIGAAASGALTADIKRRIYARALKGRLELGGAGLTETERQISAFARRSARDLRIARGVKGVAALAALGLGAYGLKKLVTSNEKG